MKIASVRKSACLALLVGVALLCVGQSSKAQWPVYGPVNPIPYNPYLPYSPGQQRGWQDARIYERTGMLPQYMSPNEVRTFENKIIRDGMAPVPMQPVFPMRPFPVYRRW